jgi:hypothetical protein
VILKHLAVLLPPNQRQHADPEFEKFVFEAMMHHDETRFKCILTTINEYMCVM